MTRSADPMMLASRFRSWDVYGDCNNYAVLKGHKAAVLQIQYSTDNVHLWSCSADKMVMLWDIEVGCHMRLD